MDKTKIREAFDRAATSYDVLALFQRQVCERMLCLLPQWLPTGRIPKRLLDGGCGTGFGSQCLKCLWPDASLIGCDLSSRMVEYMRQKGFEAVTGDLENLPFPDARFDFVWSSLALQWCHSDTVFHELSRVLDENGILYFSTLAPGTLGEIDFAFSGLDDANRLLDFLPVTTLKARMHEAGFTDIHIKHETHKMYYPDVRSALESVRGIGAGHTAGKRRALLGKNAWKTVQKRYESLRDENGLPLTYELVIGYGMTGR